MILLTMSSKRARELTIEEKAKLLKSELFDIRYKAKLAEVKRDKQQTTN